MHTEELRLKMDVAIGRAPPLTDGQMQGRLRHEAHELLAEFREHNKQVRSAGMSTGTHSHLLTRTSVPRTRSVSDASRNIGNISLLPGFGTHDIDWRRLGLGLVGKVRRSTVATLTEVYMRPPHDSVESVLISLALAASLLT